MKLKNVKVGQRVKIKKRVGFNNQDTFTIENKSQRYGKVLAVDYGAWPVRFEPDDSPVWTRGNAEDLKLIEDVQ